MPCEKHSHFVCLALMAVSFVACKKDYPKDIPEWLEKRIKQMKKENECNDSPIQIQEYKGVSNDTILYLFTKPCQFCKHVVYNYNGSLLCNDIEIWTGHDSCGNLSFTDYDFHRMIWTETCK
jgi:hypothetical protein